MTNPFFKNNGPLNLKDICQVLEIDNGSKNKKVKIFDIADLNSASTKDITFLHSSKYTSQASITKAAACITTKNLHHILPDKCEKIIVENVLISIAKITEILYPDSVNDDFDNSVKEISKTKLKNKVKFGKNVLIGSNVKIGKNCSIGHNTIIEKNVIIGDNCSIGSNTIIRNTILKNHIKVLDGCVIGKNPNPCLPITHPSKIFTLSLIIVFLIIVFDPIEQLFPILTFFSIIELWPIKQFDPKDTFLPIKTFLPNLTLSLNFVSDIEIPVSSKLSLIESG